ncbi:MAG: ClpXP protease specificity-enhancing factor SspB [Pseudomonadota bacterium]
MMQRAMQALLAEALGVVSEHGLPGEHHFYITFVTAHPDVEMPDWLREDYPKELTIVIQHQFEGLNVGDEAFEVTLQFGGRPAALSIPFAAILQFADPAAEFGLRFDPADHVFDDEDEEDLEDEGAEPDDNDADDAPRGEVVSLDAFRKR